MVVTVLLKKARSRICGLAIIDRMRDFVGSYWHVPMPWAQGGGRSNRPTRAKSRLFANNRDSPEYLDAQCMRFNRTCSKLLEERNPSDPLKVAMVFGRAPCDLP